MLQMKEQNKTPEKELNQSVDKQSTIHRAQNTGYKDTQWSQKELQQRGRKHQKEPGRNEEHNNWNEDYIIGNQHWNRWGRDWVSNLEDKVAENTQSEEPKEERLQKVR